MGADHHVPGDQSALAQTLSWESVLPREILDHHQVTYHISEGDPGCLHLGVNSSCAVLRDLPPSTLRLRGTLRSSVSGWLPHTQRPAHQTAALDELIRSDVILCRECLPEVPCVDPNSPAGWVKTSQEIDTHLAKRTSDGNVKALRKRQQACQDALRLLERVTYTPTSHYPDGGEELLRTHALRYQEELARIIELQSGEAARSALLLEVQKQLVTPTSLRQGYPLEDELCLVGIVHFQTTEWGDLAGQLVEQFALRGRKDELTVLLLPRYGATWLVRTASGERSKMVHPPVSAAGDPSEVQETAAGLWDPTSEGVLQSMLGALQAARSLHAASSN